MYKLIIAGSRKFNNPNILRSYTKQILESLYKKGKLYPGYYDSVEIISGGANGADKLGERFANDYIIQLKIFLADWNKHGKSAGYIRNEEMAKYADGLVAFWDGKSRGTKHMIELAKKHNLDVWVLQYDD